MSAYPVHNQPKTATSRLPLLVGVIVALLLLLVGAWVLMSTDLLAKDDTGEEAGDASSSAESSASTSTSPSTLGGIGASGHGFVCGADGKKITCAGQNQLGALGSDDTAAYVNSFELDGDVQIIDAGENFACASAGVGLTCWGDNRWRQALDSDVKRVNPTPVRALQGRHITALALGAYHACAIADSELLCWGADNSGQLGRGEPGKSANSPQTVTLPDGKKPSRLYSSDFSTFVETDDHEWYGFGANNDNRINDSELEQLAPVKIG